MMKYSLRGHMRLSFRRHFSRALCTRSMCGGYTHPNRDQTFWTAERKELKPEAAVWRWRRPTAKCPWPGAYLSRGTGKVSPFGQQTRPSANKTPPSREVSRLLTTYDHEPRSLLGCEGSLASLAWRACGGRCFL